MSVPSVVKVVPMQESPTVGADLLVDAEALLRDLPVGRGGPIDCGPEEGEALPACFVDAWIGGGK